MLDIFVVHCDKVTKDNNASQIKPIDGIDKNCLPVPREKVKTPHFHPKPGPKLAQKKKPLTN
jgi:hypothetical protein